MEDRIKNAGYKCTGYMPAREADAEDIRDHDHVWLVSFQRGFEQMDVAVYADKGTICDSDAEQAAVEFVESANRQALTDEEIENREADQVRSCPNPFYGKEIGESEGGGVSL